MKIRRTIVQKYSNNIPHITSYLVVWKRTNVKRACRVGGPRWMQPAGCSTELRMLLNSSCRGCCCCRSCASTEHPTCLLMENRNKSECLFHLYRLTRRY